MRAVYTFNSRMWLRVIGQYVDTERDPDLYKVASPRDSRKHDRMEPKLERIRLARVLLTNVDPPLLDFERLDGRHQKLSDT